MSVDRAKIQWNGWGWAAAKDELASREELWLWLADELGMPSLLATPARPLEEIALPAPRLSAAQRENFVSLLGADRVRDDKFERTFHALGRSYHDVLRLRAGNISAAPDAVLYPRGTEEVLSILSTAAENNIAVVPYGGGTSVVGGVSANGASFPAVVTVDLSGMDRLIDVDAVSGTATAEAGIYGPALEKALQAKGVTLGHFPQSFEFSTLGGWIAHRGAGQNSVLYGRADDWLVSARLATPRGLLATEEFPASAAGPRLTDVIAGSEGAFGIVTEATFRIHPAPAASHYGGYLFHDFASGAAAIRQAVQEDVSAAMLRLSDIEETRFYRAFGHVGKRRGISGKLEDAYLSARGFSGAMTAMIAGFEGSKEIVDYGRKRFAAIAKRHGGMSVGAGPGERWREGRFHGPYLREPMMNRAVGVDTLETAVRWSKVDALYAAVKTALKNAILGTAPRPGAHGIVMCHISHAYEDGASLYFTCIFPRALDGEIAQWQAIKKAASDAIATNGGTISHHHGVGEDHLPWMTNEKGALGIDVLRAIKMSLDPKGIMNPGKLIPL
ncbi:MAG: FAD-binding oxidoreductase [Proteobacteria bacterium]|nr:FAD-binding oxidoreductase [Pseudomonadota bacterium]